MNRMTAIATGHYESANAARTILDAGGNAVDATIAAVAVDSVVQPCLIGFAGGGFMMVHDGERTRCIDMMPRFPAQLAGETPKSFADKLTPVNVDFGKPGRPNTQRFWMGTKSVAPPGILPGLVYAKQQYGTDLPWRTILRPAIELARHGIVLSPFQGDTIIKTLLSTILIGPQAHESSVTLFSKEPGVTLEAGDVFINADYAAFLERLSENPDRDALRDAYEAHGIPYEPFKPRDIEPLVIEFRGERYETVPKPYPGGMMLKQILHGIDSRGIIHALSTDSVTRTHVHLARTFRDVFKGYPALIDSLLGNTTHISVYEKRQNASPLVVSMTGSLGETPGIIFDGNPGNNLLGEEDLNPLLHPALKRSVTAGSALLSRQTPVIRHGADGTIEALGSGGSSRITTAMAQVLLRRSAGESPSEAIAAPRLHWDGQAVRIEAAAPDVRESLQAALGVDVHAEPTGLYFGGVHLAGSEGAAGDPRREGATA